MSDQLRGICIEPSGKSKQLGSEKEIFYYLCFVDVPANVSSSDFILPSSPVSADGKTLQYTYSGSWPLTGTPENPVSFISTIALPIYTYPYSVDQKGKDILNKVEILNVNTGEVLISGNPNKRRPPVVEMMIPYEGAEPGIPTAYVLQSDLAVSISGVEEKPFFFIVAMVNTGTDGKQSNIISDFTPSGSTLEGTLTQNDSAGRLAAIGVYPSTLFQFYNMKIGTKECSISYPQAAL